MTADEFRKMLNQFHASLNEGERDALNGARKWAALYRIGVCKETRPPWLIQLGQVWRDLNRECGLMEDAERRAAEEAAPNAVCIADGKIVETVP